MAQKYTYCYSLVGSTRKHEPGFFGTSRGTLHKVRYAWLDGSSLKGEGFIWVTAGGVRVLESFRTCMLVEYDHEFFGSIDDHPLTPYIVKD
mgnify:CR=1 FL=1